MPSHTAKEKAKNKKAKTKKRKTIFGAMKDVAKKRKAAAKKGR